MLEVVLSNRFKKDLKLAAKRGCDLSLLESIVDQLAAQQPLPEKNRDHDLTGDYIGFRECHIRPDWLLIYRVDGEQLMLFLFRLTDAKQAPRQPFPAAGVLLFTSADHTGQTRFPSVPPSLRSSPPVSPSRPDSSARTGRSRLCRSRPAASPPAAPGRTRCHPHSPP